MDLVGGVLLFSLVTIIFLFSRVHQLADSNYSMLLSQSLFQYHSFTLDHYAIPRHNPKQQKAYISNGDIYQLELIDNHIYYFFPPGSSMLSVPHVALMNALGVSASNPDGTYNREGEAKIQIGLAALLMAGLTTIIFFTSRLLLSFWWSMLLTLGSALGTQIWSTASRALWPDTWGIFIIGSVIWILAAVETKRCRLRPILLATLLSWSYFVKPTFSISIIAVTVYVFIYHRSAFTWYFLSGAAWCFAFIGYSQYHFGQLLPNYYQGNRLSFSSFWEALAGNLISPSRGLLVFVPILLFIAYLLIRYRSELASLRLFALSITVIVVHLIVVSGFSPWWGGHCYGPRYSAGLVPWFSLLGILAIKSRLQSIEKGLTINQNFWRRAELTAGVLLLFCSVAINGIGAMDVRTWVWNVNPVNIDEKPERVWDWRDPQFLAK